MSNILKNLLSCAPKAGKLGMGSLCLALGVASCSDMDEYFETPSWLRGSIYETLNDEGNHSVFLAGAEKAGFRPLMEGKSIVTVMAPNDEKLTAYMNEHYGTADINSIPIEELQKLIGFHILYYSFDKNNLVNFRPMEGDGATEDELLTNAGLYYKFRTKSQDPITVEQAEITTTDASTGTSTTDVKNVDVYHLERYVPVFSYQMFRTKTINAAENYNYFFPGMWRDDNGFNVSNAGVEEYSVPTSNGYIYYVDNVLTPLQTIYTELKNRPQFSRFLTMYDKYSNYVADSTLTVDYGNGKELYQHYHNKDYTLAPIACEWPVTNYRQVVALASRSYSVFAFSNDAFESFFNDFWGQGGYESMDDPDLAEPVRDLLLNSYTTESVAFPEEIEKGLVLNYNIDARNPTPIRFDPNNDVAQENRVMCSNGVLYGCSKLTPPAKYNSVTGPAYQYKKFSYFLNMLSASGMTNTLSLESEKYIMLYPSNRQMADKEGYEFDETGKLVTVAGNTPTAVNTATKSATINAHVASPDDGNTILPLTGKKVIQAFTPDMKLYWYIKDGKLTNSIKHNERLKYAENTATDEDIWAAFELLGYRGDPDGWTNGHAYQYDNLVFHGNYAASRYNNFLTMMWSLRTDDTTDFYGWINLLNKSGLVNNTGQMALMTESSLMFVPTTRILEQAILDGKLPGIKAADDAVAGSADFFANCEVTNQDVLQTYLLSYFVPLSSAVMSNYPYPGWGENTKEYGGLITFDQDAEKSDIATRLNIYDDGTRLSVTRTPINTATESPRVMVSDAYDTFPFIFEDGCVHFIEDVLPLVNGK